jgi:hypothetical protein
MYQGNYYGVLKLGLKCSLKVHVPLGPQPVALLGSSGTFKSQVLGKGNDVLGDHALEGDIGTPNLFCLLDAMN